MIPKKTLIKTIEDFDEKFKNLNEKLKSETEETWTLEKFQEWQKYEEAWRQLELVIELQILPLAE